MITTKVGRRVVSFTGSGTQYDGQFGQKPYLGKGSWTLLAATEVVDSTKSPNYWRKSQTMVKFVPRSGRYPTKPREPRFFEPRKPFLRPRRPNQGNRSWNRTLKRFDQRIKAYDTVFLQKKHLFDQRYQKYLVRMAKYHAFVEKLKNGVPKKVRVRVDAQPQWNYYKRSITFDTGAQGTYRVNWRQWVYGKPIQGYYAHDGFISEYIYSSNWPTTVSQEVLSKAGAAADSLALSRFHEKLSSEQVHIGQILAERAQTIGLLADAVTRMARFLTLFRLKNLGKAIWNLVSSNNPKKIANDYLAFQFGVLPLISDVEGAAELVAHFNVDKLDQFVIRVVGSAVKSETEEKVVTSSTAGRTFQFTTRVEVKVRYVCEYTLNNVVTREMSKVGLINPAEILWELVPWSFIVDWLLPIGDYLRHLTNETGLSFSRGSKTVTTKTVVTCKQLTSQKDPFTVPMYWGSEQWIADSITQTRGQVIKERNLLTKSPYVQLPAFKSPISLTHVLESLALLVQSRYK